MYQRKTLDEFQIHQNLGGTWEEIAAYATLREGRTDIIARRANQPGDYRLVKRRVRIAPAATVTTNQATETI